MCKPERRKSGSFYAFVLKAFFLVVISWLTIYIYIDFAIPYFFNRSHPYITYHRDFVTKSKSVYMEEDFRNQDPEILFMGDSTVVYGIIPEMIAPKSRNISMAGGSSIEAYYFLKYHYMNHKPPKKIFLSISHGTMEWNDGFVPRTMKLHIFPLKDFVEIINTTILLNDAPYNYSFDKTDFLWSPNRQHPVNNPPDKFKQFLQLILYRMNFIYYYHASISLRGFYNTKNFERNRKAYLDMEKNLGFRSRGRRSGRPVKNVAASQNHESFYPSATHTHYVKKIMEMASLNGTEVIWEFLPVNETSYKTLASRKKFMNSHDEFIKELKKEFPEHKIEGKITPYPQKLMFDSSHLNINGARKYSKELKRKYFLENKNKKRAPEPQKKLNRRAAELSYYDSSDRIWVHRVNSIERLKMLQPYYDGIEVDLVYIEKENVLSVSHSTRRTSSLTLDRYLNEFEKKYDAGLWFDIKNLQETNMYMVFNRIEYLVEKHGLKRRRIVVESMDINSLLVFTDAGYRTSYYLPTGFLRDVKQAREASKLSFDQMEKLREINQEVLNSGISAVSTDCMFIKEVADFIPDAPSAMLWGPRLSYLNGEHRLTISSLLEKYPKVQVFLVGDLTPFYR